VYTAVGGHAYGSVYSGPMGAVLTPALAGLPASKHLPGASTLCGRCESVCPVDIPIPRMLRLWRERAHAGALTARAERVGLGLWRRIAERPWLYRPALALAARVLRSLSVPGPQRDRRRLRRLPWGGSGWTLMRDMPAPEGETFQQRWRRRQRARIP
jgi:L-lactate dehydrogenase complex protein LldF